MSTEFETIQKTENRVTLEPPGRWKVVFLMTIVHQWNMLLKYYRVFLVMILGKWPSSENAIAVENVENMRRHEKTQNT